MNFRVPSPVLVWSLLALPLAPQATAQTAPVLTSWTLTTPEGTDEAQTRAAFSADGKRAVFLMGNRLSVYALAPTGALGGALWNSPPTQKVTAFV